MIERFEVKESGLYYGNTFVAEFDNQILEIIHLISPDGTNYKEKVVYVIGITTKAGEKLSPARFSDLNKINYFTTWSEITDADLSVKNRKLLKLRLQQTAHEAKKVVQINCDKSGLFKYSNSNFLILGNKCFGKDKPFSKADITISDELKIYQWQNTNEYGNKYSTYFEFLLNIAPNASEILTYAVFLSVTKPFFNAAGYIPDFCINLYGKSGTRKTSLVKALANIIDSKELVLGSFMNDRKRQLLDKIKNAYGFPFILDDYHPAASAYDAKKQNSIMDSIVREMEGNSSTAMVIMTSEFLEGSFSLQDRMLQIEIQTVNLDELSKLQKLQGLMSKLAQDLVQNLIQNYDEVIEFIKKEFSAGLLRNIHTRTERHGLFLMVVAKLCSKYLLCNDSMFENRLKEALDFQFNIQKKHLERIRYYENNENYVLILNDLLESGIFEIVSDIDKRMGKNQYMQKPNQIYFKENRIYMTKGALNYGMSKFLRSSQIDLKKIIKSLSESDLLLEDSDTPSKKFKDKRHLCISYLALKEYVELMEN